MGMPRKILAKMNPHIRGGVQDPTKIARSDHFCQRGSSTFLRHSRPTTRIIKDTSTRNNGRYIPENIVAYHSGNAANSAPPATISHTSLPSQTGPMVRMIVFLAAESLPMNGAKIPTPKSKPSRRKYPANKNAMRTNQKVLRSMVIPFHLWSGRKQ